MGIEVFANGAFPSLGLIVSNHLSYLDILVFSTATPCVFVSKAEVANWVIIGQYARRAGTVFVHRHDRTDAARANVSIAASLRNRVPVVLFPEGGTTNGHEVLRFHASMLQPAIEEGETVTPCAIAYELQDGSVEQEICWWGNMPLLAHALNLLGKRTIQARIVFGEPLLATGDRKQLSQCLHRRVDELQAQLRKTEMTS